MLVNPNNRIYRLLAAGFRCQWVEGHGDRAAGLLYKPLKKTPVMAGYRADIGPSMQVEQVARGGLRGTWLQLVQLDPVQGLMLYFEAAQHIV